MQLKYEWPQPRHWGTGIALVGLCLATTASLFAAEPGSPVTEVTGFDGDAPIEATAAPGDGLASAKAVGSSAKVVVRLSEQLLQLLIFREVNRESKIDRVMFGAQVVGVAHTTGKVQIRLLPGGDQALFRLTLEGQTTAKTTSSRGAARVLGLRVTPFEAHKQVRFDGRRFLHQPADVTVHPSQADEEIGAAVAGLRGRLVRTVAERQVERLRQAADAIAQQDARTHISESFDAAVERHLARLNRRVRMQRYARGMLREAPVRLHLCTTSDYLQISFCSGVAHPPRLPQKSGAEPPAAIELWVHDSLLQPETRQVLQHRPGLGEVLAEAFPTAERPVVRTCSWLTEVLIQLRLATDQRWIVVKAGPLPWLASMPISSSAE